MSRNKRNKVMSSEAGMFAKWRSLRILLLISLMYAVAASSGPTLQVSQTQASPQSSQKSFGTPKEAAEALIQAAKTYDVDALKSILGRDGEDLVSSEDPVQDKNRASAFAAMAKEKNQVTVDPKNPKRAILSIGNDDWP